MCPRVGHPAPCYLSEFLLCSWSTRLFHPYSGLILLVPHYNSFRLLQPLVPLTSTLALSFFRFFFYIFAFRRLFTSAARSILSEKLSARPDITLGRSTRQRGNQHSGIVHTSLLRYTLLMLPKAQSFTVTVFKIQR